MGVWADRFLIATGLMIKVPKTECDDALFSCF